MINVEILGLDFVFDGTSLLFAGEESIPLAVSILKVTEDAIKNRPSYLPMTVSLSQALVQHLDPDDFKIGENSFLTVQDYSEGMVY